jgi:hypothetical protein
MPHVYVTLAETAANEEKIKKNRHSRRRNETIVHLQSIDNIEKEKQIL